MGKRWQALTPKERQRREDEARVVREQYRADVIAYKKTDEYRQYREYMERFNAEEANRKDGENKAAASLRDSDIKYEQRPIQSEGKKTVWRSFFGIFARLNGKQPYARYPPSSCGLQPSG